MSILIAMLLPALNKAREAARTVQCASNERQMAMAILMYSNEHKGWMLPYASPYGASTMIWQSTLIVDKYIASGSTTRYWVPAKGLDCPVNHNGYNIGATEAAGDYYDGAPDYMYNRRAGQVGEAAFPLRRLSQIKRAAAKAMLLEGAHIQVVTGDFRCHYIFQNVAGRFTPGNANYYIADVHNNGSNVTFFDGHVAYYKSGTVTIDMADPFN